MILIVLDEKRRREAGAGGKRGSRLASTIVCRRFAFRTLAFFVDRQTFLRETRNTVTRARTTLNLCWLIFRVQGRSNKIEGNREGNSLLFATFAASSCYETDITVHFDCLTNKILRSDNGAVLARITLVQILRYKVIIQLQDMLSTQLFLSNTRQSFVTHSRVGTLGRNSCA